MPTDSQKSCLNFNHTAEVCFTFMHSTDILRYIYQYVQLLGISIIIFHKN